jgi:hypothetical protein
LTAWGSCHFSALKSLWNAMKLQTSSA